MICISKFFLTAKETAEAQRSILSALITPTEKKIHLLYCVVMSIKRNNYRQPFYAMEVYSWSFVLAS